MLKINDKFESIRGMYIIKNLINGKEYIGKTMNMKERMAYHSSGKRLTIHLAIRKYGIENFQVYCEYFPEKSEDELFLMEKSMIAQYNTIAPNGYNISEGGRGISGYRHTEETKKIISEKHKGSNNYFYGKKHTQETKDYISSINRGRVLTLEQRSKISKNTKGVPRTLEVRKKISEKNLGRRANEETRKRISEGHLGQIPWNKGKKGGVFQGKTHSDETKEKLRNLKLGKHLIIRSIIQKTPDGVVVAEFSSMREASKKTGVARVAISKACKGLRNIIDGYIWEYKDHVEL